MFAANQMQEIWWLKWHRTKNPRCNITEHGFDMVWLCLIGVVGHSSQLGGPFRRAFIPFRCHKKKIYAEWFNDTISRQKNIHSRLTDHPVVAILSFHEKSIANSVVVAMFCMFIQYPFPYEWFATKVELILSNHEVSSSSMYMIYIYIVYIHITDHEFIHRNRTRKNPIQ